MDELEIASRAATAMYENDVAIKELGMQVEAVSANSATTRFVVRADMLNGHAVCHGGFIFALADTALAYACNARGWVTYAASADIEFLRPARLGDELVAVAEERHRGSRTGVYDVVVRNQDGEQIALFRGRSHSTRDRLVPET